MFKTTAAALFMTTALAGAAMAQTTAPSSTSTAPAATAPMTSAASTTSGTATGGVVTQQSTGEFRASKFVGLDIYGSENQKIGDIKEILIDSNGQAKAIIIGVGGFLGIGEKNVAVAWNQVEWKLDRATTTSSTAPAATTGTTNTAATGTTASTSSSSSSSRSPTEQAAYNGYPDHGVVKMSKADLQNAPDFKYYSDTASSSGSRTNATTPARQ